METADLQKWLSELQPKLVAAVAKSIREHVAELRSLGVDFYGYALLPGEPYAINNLVAVANTEADIKVPRTADQYSYHRYSVDEWKHWKQDGFAPANRLLKELNKQFKSLHSKARGKSEKDKSQIAVSNPFLPSFVSNLQLDEVEIAYSNVLLNSVVSGFLAAKDSGAFGDSEKFLVVWISDSDHKVVPDSVQRLNSAQIAKEFLQEFGGDARPHR